jgi:hypothetical protein
MKDYFVGRYYSQHGAYTPAQFHDFLGRCPIDLDCLRHMVGLGEAATMSVRVDLAEGISMVRPLLFVSESETLSAQKHRGYRSMGLECPFRKGREPTNSHSKRELVQHHLRKLTASDESLEGVLFEMTVSTVDENGRVLARPRQRRSELYPGL